MPPTARARPPRRGTSMRCSRRGKTSTACAARVINATHRCRNQPGAYESAPWFLRVARGDPFEPDDPGHRVDRSHGADGAYPVDRGGPVFGPDDRPEADGSARARSAARAGLRALPARHLVDLAG